MKRKRPTSPEKARNLVTAPDVAPSPDSATAPAPVPTDKPVVGRGWALLNLVFLSGFACLVYQILWMRQLGLLFGNTAHAAALTLAVFFAGLACGSWYWGRRSTKIANPLRLYGRLEYGIAVCGLAILIAPALCRSILPMLYGEDGSGLGIITFKVLWTLLMIFPSAWLMGGTIPVLGQHLIRRRLEFGEKTAKIYAINTIGAACGAFASAFVLIWQLGYNLTCILAIAVSSLIGVLSYLMAGKDPAANSPIASSEADQTETATSEAGMPRLLISGMAFLSGFNILALEVLWTRMFAQVHENSVYSFSAVLIIVLICLALGAAVSSWLAAAKFQAASTLTFLIFAGGALLSVSPFVFMWLTNNLRMLATDTSFSSYMASLFATGFVAIGPPSLLLGAVFPFLMKAEEHHATHPGKSIGRLAAINTLGAILGSLVCGFILLRWLGLWHSVQCLAAIYLVVALCIPSGKNLSRLTKIGALAMLALTFTRLNPSALPATLATDSNGQAQTLVETWQATDCTVAVVKNDEGHYSIKINSNYSLGSSASYASQMFQARIPLLAFPDTTSVFFLGMGTGITAGEALDSNAYPGIERVVTCELSPSVVAASKKYFAGGTEDVDLTNGLFTDPRSQVMIADGRTHLMATREKFDMINADLFLPYRSGTGSLYSEEHFKSVKKRLNPGGVFVQWVPLYQTSEQEFGVIARTMISVFPQVSLWRANFQPGAEMVALVGHHDQQPLPECDLDSRQQKIDAVTGASHYDLHRLRLPINPQTILLFYCGNLSEAAGLFAAYPLNTEDKPVIEFGTPRSLHQPDSRDRPHFVGEKFAGLVDKLQQHAPPATDPLLALRGAANRKLPLAGTAFQRAWIASLAGDEWKTREYWHRFLGEWINTADQ